MKYIIAAAMAIVVLSFSGLFALSVQAQNFTPGTNSPTCAPGKLCNPLKVSSIKELIPKLIDIVIQIGLVVCTFFIIMAGFKYVTANGNSTQVTQAHNILKWAVVGTAVLLGAKTLASILANTVQEVIK